MADATIVTLGAGAVFSTFQVAGQSDVDADGNLDTLTLAAGSNITLTTNGSTDTVTIAAASATDSFKTIQVSGQSDVVADDTEDVLIIAAGSNVTITTNAGTDTVTITAADTNTQLTDEQVQDIIGGMVTGNTETNISVTYEDGDGTLDFVSTDTQPLTTEAVQDIVGGMVTGNTETNISVTYEDGDGTLDFVSTDTQPLTTEAVQDIVGGMVTGNTETNISVTYEDGDGTLDFVSTDTLSGWTDGTNVVTLTTAADKVGIGQGTPLVALDVAQNPTGLSDDTGGGEVLKFGSGSLTAGKLYYLHTDGAWTLTDANAVASGASQLLGIALGTSPTTHGMLIRGFFDVASYLTGTFVQGGAVYVSETTTGNIDVAAPAGGSDYVRIVGYGTTTANVIYFNPSNNWVQL